MSGHLSPRPPREAARLTTEVARDDLPPRILAVMLRRDNAATRRKLNGNALRRPIYTRKDA